MSMNGCSGTGGNGGLFGSPRPWQRAFDYRRVLLKRGCGLSQMRGSLRLERQGREMAKRLLDPRQSPAAIGEIEIIGEFPAAGFDSAAEYVKWRDAHEKEIED